MGYFDTPQFDGWVKGRQKRMLPGIFEQVMDRIIDWNREVELPIFHGDARWREFRVSLKSFRVMASYTAPFGGTARRVGGAVLDSIIRLAGSPKQIGSHYTLFDVPNPRFWRRESNVSSWHRYKFVLFVEEDPDDKDTPYEEIYLTLWELQLLSAEAMTGEGRSRTAGEGEKVKRDEKAPPEKPVKRKKRESGGGDDAEETQPLEKGEGGR